MGSRLELELLATLADGEAFGYVLLDRLRGRSGGSLEPAASSVYPALHRLERARLATSTWRTLDGRRRRLYRLTRRGRKQLRIEDGYRRLIGRSLELALR